MESGIDINHKRVVNEIKVIQMSKKQSRVLKIATFVI